MKIFSQIGLDHLLVIDRFRWKTFEYFFSEIDNNDAGRHAKDDLDDVFDDGQCDPPLPYHRDELKCLFGLLGVEAGKNLIEEEQFWLGCQGPGDFEAFSAEQVQVL